MLYQGRVDRAAKLQREKNRRQYNMDMTEEGKPYGPAIADEMEKGDMLALVLSGCLTIIPVCAAALLAIVAAGMLFFRIF